MTLLQNISYKTRDWKQDCDSHRKTKLFINSEISSEEKKHFRFEDCVQEPGVSGSSGSRKPTR
jgi:hypothetical protein